MAKKNEIKFSHQYSKLHGQVRATLLDVTDAIASDSLHNEFVTIDTEYRPDTQSVEYYPLPKGLVVVLTFSGNKKIPFTTIRRGTAKALTKYQSLIGKEFDLVIEDEVEFVPSALDAQPYALEPDTESIEAAELADKVGI